MVITIRPALAEDAESLYEMITGLARHLGEQHSVQITTTELHQQLSEPNCPFECVIAEIDGRPSGFALFFYTYSSWEGSRTLYLEDLYVCPPSRSAGVGTALMSFLALTAQQQQCRRIDWSVLDWDDQAIGFYQRLGGKAISGSTKYRLDAETIASMCNH